MANLPLSSFHFIVDWGGRRIGFAQVTGMSFESDVIEYRDGASPNYSTVKMPGLKKNSAITFERGIVHGDNDFFDWFNTIQLNDVQRRDLTLSLLNEAHEPIVVYKIRNAWPSKLLASGWNAINSTFAIETMVVQHEGLILEHI